MRYLNFDLQVFDYKPLGTADQFSVRVAFSPVGEQRDMEAERVRLPVGVRQKIGPLRQRRLSLAEMIELGEDLGKALFPPRVRYFLNASLARLRDQDERLRIRLMLDTYGLAELPWEYVYLPPEGVPDSRRGPEGFIALNRSVSLVRYELQGKPLVSLDAGASPIRLVALLANPMDRDYEPLDVAKEKEAISRGVTDITNLQADYYSDPTPDTLLAALVKPAHIFHFSGHGKFQGDQGERIISQEGTGAVVLVDEQRHAAPFSAQKLALNLTGRGVRLAVLTACEVAQTDASSAWAGVVTALTHAGIPAVVGMQFRIRDTNAIAFSKAFYRALAAGQPIDAAVADGRLAIFNRGDDNERDWGVPVLYLRAEEGVLFPQEVQPTTSASRRPTPGTEAQPQETRQVITGQAAAAIDRRALREAMTRAFSSGELEILCGDIQADLAANGVDLQVNLDVIGGSSKPLQVLNLIQFLERRGYLDYLVRAVRSTRPGII